MRTLGLAKNDPVPTHELSSVVHVAAFGPHTAAAEDCPVMNGSEGPLIAWTSNRRGSSLTPPCVLGRVKNAMYFCMSLSLPPSAAVEAWQPLKVVFGVSRGRVPSQVMP